MSSLPPDPEQKDLAQSLFGLLARAAIINFVVFVIIAAILGGDALNALRDPAAARRWALKGPGTTDAFDVAPWVWVYSVIHASLSIGLVLVTLILGVLRLGPRKSHTRL